MADNPAAAKTTLATVKPIQEYEYWFSEMASTPWTSFYTSTNKVYALEVCVD